MDTAITLNISRLAKRREELMKKRIEKKQSEKNEQDAYEKLEHARRLELVIRNQEENSEATSLTDMEEEKGKEKCEELSVDTIVEQNTESPKSITLSHEEFSTLYNQFRKTFTDQLKSKKTKRYIFEDYDAAGTMDESVYFSIISQSNTFLRIAFEGRRANLHEIRQNERNQDTKFSNFAVGIFVMLKHLGKRLQEIAAPYRVLKMKVQEDLQICEITNTLKNYTIAFPVKVMFFSQGDAHHYLFIAPGYDVFEFVSPVLLPNLGTEEFTTNNCLNMFYEKNPYFYSHEKDKICQLINRCTITPKTLKEITEAPLKLTKIVLLMCEKVRFKHTWSEAVIFSFIMRCIIKKRKKDKEARMRKLKFAFLNWCTSLIEDVKYRRSCATKLVLWIKRIRLSDSLIRHSMVLKSERNYKFIKSLRKVCEWKITIIDFGPIDDSKPWERFFIKPVWYSSLQTYSKLLNKPKLSFAVNFESELIKVIDPFNIAEMDQVKDFDLNMKTFGAQAFPDKVSDSNVNAHVKSIKGKESGKKEEEGKKEKEKTPIITSKERNNQSKWHGFNRNNCLRNLIFATGETLDILEINVQSRKDDNYLRVKKCIGAICQITKSKQYIKFCRSLYGKNKSGGRENIEEFYKCFGNKQEFDLQDALAEVCLFSNICKNKWFLHVLNNIESYGEKQC